MLSVVVLAKLEFPESVRVMRLFTEIIIESRDWNSIGKSPTNMIFVRGKKYLEN